MATTNDITGDAIMSRVASKAYLNHFDEIFRKDKTEPLDLFKGYHWQSEDTLRNIVELWDKPEFANNSTTQEYVRQAKEKLKNSKNENR